MDRNTLKLLLQHYRTPFEEEAAYIDDFIALTDDDLAFKRERLDGHFTGSAWIVNKKRTHTLLTLHGKLNRWLQLGGHADGNENLLEVAMMEAKEESGLISLRLMDANIFDLDKHLIPASDGVPQHLHYDVRFLIEAEIDEPLSISKESKDLAWVPFDIVQDITFGNVSMMRMLEKTSKSEYVF